MQKGPPQSHVTDITIIKQIPYVSQFECTKVIQYRRIVQWFPNGVRGSMLGT